MQAAAWSRYRWGYWFAPPPLPAAVLDATSVLSATRFMAYDNGTSRSVDLKSLHPTSDQMRNAPRFRDEPDYRIPYQLMKSGLLAAQPPALTVRQLNELTACLSFTHQDMYSGEVYELDSPQGRLMVFTGISFPLDHRTYRETVMHLNSARRPTIVSSTSFRYDSAHLEYLSWSLVFSVSWLFLSILGILRVVQRHRQRRGTAPA
jgi:hypothetical protein